MIKTNNTPAESRKSYGTIDNATKQDITQTLTGHADSGSYGTCNRCSKPAIGPHGYCADHL